MTRRLLALLLCLFIGVQSISATHTHSHHKDATPSFSTGMYVIESQHSNKVLQSSKTGHILQSHLDSDHTNMFQRFYLIHLEDNTYYLIGGHNRKMIEVTADGTAPQERQDFSFGDEDRWKVSVKPEGGFSFQHMQSAKYLSAKPKPMKPHMTDDESEPGTVFKVYKHINDGVYTIKAKDSSHYLHFDNNRAFLKSHPDVSTAGKFFVKTHGPKHLSIVDFKTNHALTHDINLLHLTTSPYTEEASQKLVSFIEEGHFFKFQSSKSEHLLARCESEDGDDAENRLCLSSEGLEGAFELIQELTAPVMNFNERAFLSTHNSYSSVSNGFGLYYQQEGSITNQLENGVRSVNFDIWSIDPDFLPTGKNLTDPLIDCPLFLSLLHYDEAGIYVFHNIREMGCIPNFTMSINKALRLSDLMQEVVDFLNKNLEEIVIIDFEDDGWWANGIPQGPEFNLLVAEYARVKGLDKLTYNLDTDPVLSVAKSRSWPRIQDMVKANRRLIMFPKRNYYSEEQAKKLPLSVGIYKKTNDEINGYRYHNNNPLETVADTTGGDFACTDFEKDMTKFNVTNPLFTLNHIRKMPSLKPISFNDNDFFLLWSRVQECLENGVPFVNSIQVDYYQTPNNEAGLVIKKINEPTTRAPNRIAQCKLSYQRIVPADMFDNKDIFSTTSLRICPAGTEDDQIRDQCVYPCPSGWISDSLKNTCYSPCQEGATQDPSRCNKIKDSYSRPVYGQYFKSQCDQAVGKSCEGVPFAWYPKCRNGYLPYYGTCFRMICPTGTTEANGVCVPESTPRRRDTPTCKDGMDYIPDPDIKSCVAPCIRNFETRLVGGAKTAFCDAKKNQCYAGFNPCSISRGCIKGDSCGMVGKDPTLPYPVCNIY